jgi:hypothetical protein
MRTVSPKHPDNELCSGERGNAIANAGVVNKDERLATLEENIG